MKITFLNQIKVQAIDSGKWELTEEYQAAIEIKEKLLIVKIPPKFETDFCSVPRMPFVYLLMSGLGHHAGLIHDALYSDLSEIIVSQIAENQDIQFTREWADKVFLYALKACGVNIVYRHLMYYAVRLNGGRYWKKGN